MAPVFNTVVWFGLLCLSGNSTVFSTLSQFMIHQKTITLAHQRFAGDGWVWVDNLWQLLLEAGKFLDWMGIFDIVEHIRQALEWRLHDHMIMKLSWQQMLLQDRGDVEPGEAPCNGVWSHKVFKSLFKSSRDVPTVVGSGWCQPPLTKNSHHYHSTATTDLILTYTR